MKTTDVFYTVVTWDCGYISAILKAPKRIECPKCFLTRHSHGGQLANGWYDEAPAF